ncbi:MAG: hypothetical protein ABR512_10735 [Desulfopila sp.]
MMAQNNDQPKQKDEGKNTPPETEKDDAQKNGGGSGRGLGRGGGKGRRDGTGGGKGRGGGGKGGRR